MIKYTKRNTAIASGATFAQNQRYDTLKIFKHFLPLSLARKPHIPLPDAVTREIITALSVICAQNQ